ncbi:MAG: phosphonate metabolism protein/1,5-bisphosphokinase (PRPP-forming) PhnN [Alphaproteobacteria bacterium]|nr:phosphonate metabolism protein/1,5-bisphosphokinase (PRPP-forming) PhnN [Alphaproteobacteria bacterium]
MASPGCLVLVVGPSGAGKDTLLRRAAAALRDEGRYCFVRRYITRPAGDPHEDHVALTEEEFAACERAGRFSLSWRAHGFSYALPASVAELIANRRIVAANASRTVVREAQSRFARVGVIHVTASAEVLARRIGDRGRETPKERTGRLARSVPEPAANGYVRTLVNEGPLEVVAGSFVGMLRSFAA